MHLTWDTIERSLRIAAWALLALAVLLSYLAFLRDRAKGRRRCHRCGYDMRATTGLRCPECGRLACDERELLRTRRRWRLAFAAGVLVLVAYPGLVVERIRAEGWTGVVPTTALIIAAPVLDHPSWSERFNSKTQPLPASKELACTAFFGRMSSPATWRWQRHLLIARCIRGDSRRPLCSDAWREVYGQALKNLYANQLAANLPENKQMLVGWPVSNPGLGTAEYERVQRALAIGSIYSRQRWPVGVPVRIGLGGGDLTGASSRVLVVDAQLPAARPLERWIDGMDLICRLGQPSYRWSDGEEILGIADQPAAGVRCTLRLNEATLSGIIGPVVFSSTETLPIAIGGSVSDVMTPVQDPAIASGLSNLVAQLTPTDGRNEVDVLFGAWGNISEPLVRAMNAAPDVTLALHLELFRDGNLFAVGEAWWRGDKAWGPGFDRSVLLSSPDDQIVPSPPGGGWSLRATGDPVLALRDFQSTRYWDGQVTIPVLWAPRHPMAIPEQ